MGPPIGINPEKGPEGRCFGRNAPGVKWATSYCQIDFWQIKLTKNRWLEGDRSVDAFRTYRKALRELFPRGIPGKRRRANEASSLGSPWCVARPGRMGRALVRKSAALLSCWAGQSPDLLLFASAIRARQPLLSSSKGFWPHLFRAGRRLSSGRGVPVLAHGKISDHVFDAPLLATPGGGLECHRPPSAVGAFF
jgi:hypothetical protein